MKLEDFWTGCEFQCGRDRWKCTDIGSRVVVAICLSDHCDISWFDGPPYAVAETVFDEHDILVCEPVIERSANETNT